MGNMVKKRREQSMRSIMKMVLIYCITLSITIIKTKLHTYILTDKPIRIDPVLGDRDKMILWL